MYPRKYFDLFPPFPRDKDRIFVAMSFSKQFNNRWENVIEPSIRKANFEPHRVDVSRISDSVITEILDGVSNCRLVFADVTTMDGSRNGNVMYEVGLAHALRQPEEVLLFRSDDDNIPFDLANVRINSYDPDNDSTSASKVITKAIENSLQVIDVTRQLAVKSAAESLDMTAFCVMLFASEDGYLCNIQKDDWNFNPDSYEQATIRLLQFGAIESELFKDLGPEIRKHLNEKDRDKALLSYKITDFGHALLAYAKNRFVSHRTAK